MKALPMKTLIAALSLVAAVPLTMAAAAPQALPGTADASKVVAGTYAVDPNHTQAIFTLNHMGFTPLSGLVADAKGSLTIDPAHPDTAKVDVTFPLSSLSAGVEEFEHHMQSADFFDAAKYPTIHFVSTSVKVDGTKAMVTGNLTMHGVTKPISFKAKFVGAGTNPMDKKAYIGFKGKAVLKRSDWGIGKYVPLVSDEVTLTLHAGFTKG